jgi:alpha-amylase/alpha-mannosidase (GH57 family)
MALTTTPSLSTPRSPLRRKRLTPDAPAAASRAAGRYICVHGHFYQPPRENPWLETVEVQDSAAPYHDWNDRITAECYAANGASRVLSENKKIIRILNNYSRMSFNFGPTLLSWLQENAPRTYRMILDADHASAERFGGHGSAMAQVYNHIIMPLASERDARTQIRWGIRDFMHRFGRKPEGMWLAETAVNRAVLDLMAQEGIRFTVLAPNQCARVCRRPPAAESEPGDDGQTAPVAVIDESEWVGTPNATVDPTRPYRVELDEGRSIIVFFYCGAASRAIAFEGLLDSGEKFARRLLDNFQANSAEPQMVHVATDGESYGHHHKHGEMALSYAMHWIEQQGLATPTNYGQFMTLFPPEWVAVVVEESSWSCSHGVERWRSDCGCNGGKAGWNQRWRRPLREALDYLRDETAPLAEELAAELVHDLWEARDAYIDVMLDRNANLAGFLAAHTTHELSDVERVTLLELMELERHAQLMYTSCGWFFDEVSGIETVQIITYAGRVLQLAGKLFGARGAALEVGFLERLAHAKSNLQEIGNGAEVYRRSVTGQKVSLEKVGAHYAISSIFRSYPEDGALFCFDVHRNQAEVLASGRGRVAMGRARIRSRVTEECQDVCYVVLHLGDQNLSAGVKLYRPEDGDEFDKFRREVGTAVRRANLPQVIRLIDGYFGETSFALTSLFADEQHRILRTILDQTLGEMEQSLETIYEDHSSLLEYLTESNMQPPAPLALAASFAVNARLRRALDAEVFDTAGIADLLRRAAVDQVTLDTNDLSFTASQRMKRAMVRLESACATMVSAATTQPLMEAMVELIADGSGGEAQSDDNIAMGGPSGSEARAERLAQQSVEEALGAALSVAETLCSLPFEVNLWQAQNIWNDLMRRQDRHLLLLPEANLPTYRQLGRAMNISVEELVVEAGVSVF